MSKVENGEGAQLENCVQRKVINHRMSNPNDIAPATARMSLLCNALHSMQVSFRDAVWPDEEDSALADRLWGSGVHPNWQTQQLLADVLVYFIEKAYARFLEVSP